MIYYPRVAFQPSFIRTISVSRSKSLASYSFEHFFRSSALVRCSTFFLPRLYVCMHAKSYFVSDNNKWCDFARDFASSVCIRLFVDRLKRDMQKALTNLCIIDCCWFGDIYHAGAIWPSKRPTSFFSRQY